ncbi:hypothetical protein [Stieleria varia]|uniref:Uncharacterized protein n=1 Tax=Stieleria varia TaxID=2528005 RepID=A0A5C6ALS1_9BACT|nr:hypothetical protein [Stieleria varia]TWU00983.1 hypothetical protein Pla52n_43540 [Stieleria varia]
MNENDINRTNADVLLKPFSQIAVPPDVVQRLDACCDEFFKESKREGNVMHRNGLMKALFHHATISVLSLSVCVLFVAGWFVFSFGAPSRAFAQVREAVQNMQNAIITYENPNQPEQNMKVYLLKSGAFRQEFSNGLVRICSPDGERCLGLETDSKTAWYSTVEGQSDAWYPIRKIMDATRSGIQSLGTREGGSHRGFLVESESEPIRLEIWVDVETDLPVEVVESPATPDDPLYSHRHSTLRFKFNRDIARELLSLTPPEGYRLVNSGPSVPMPEVPHGIDMRKLELKPGLGMGGLTWGDDLGAAKKQIGPPSEVNYCYTIDGQRFQSRTKPDDASIDYILAEFDALGLTLNFREGGGLFSVAVESGIPDAGVRSFPGKTSENISIGDSFDQILEAYGKPTRFRGPAKSPFAVIYQNLGVAFVLEEGQVTGILVTEKESK